MRKVLILILLLTGAFLPLVRGTKLPEIREFRGEFSEVYEEALGLYGPFEEELLLEDAARLKSRGLTLEIIRDNYRGSDYLIFINN